MRTCPRCQGQLPDPSDPLRIREMCDCEAAPSEPAPEPRGQLGALGVGTGWASKRPALIIGVKPGVPPLYSLAGWEELDRYASRNQPLWCAVRRRCMESGISEIDGLKMLCAALVDESEARKETIIKYVEHSGFLPPNIGYEPRDCGEKPKP